MNKSILLIFFIFVLQIAAIAKDYSTKIPLNGSTLANNKLQYDTLLPVYSAVGISLPNCEKMEITNTEVTKKPYNLKTQNGQYVEGQWEERWTVKACGKTAIVPVKFVLDKTGAMYVISPKDVIVK